MENYHEKLADIKKECERLDSESLKHDEQNVEIKKYLDEMIKKYNIKDKLFTEE